MIKITMNVEGMHCGMCESHVNDAVRKAVKVKSVTSSHVKNQTVVIADDDADAEAVAQAIREQGYTVADIEKEPYEKKGLFSFFRKK